MISLRNVFSAIGAVLGHPGVLFLAWVVVTLPALVVTVPVVARVDDALAHQPGASYVRDLALDVDLARTTDLSVPILGAWLFVCAAFVFLAGGIVRRVGVRPRERFSEFFADCGRYFVRNLRVLLIGAIACLLLFWGGDVLRRLVRERWLYDSDTGPISIFGWQTRWISRELFVESLDWLWGLAFLFVVFVMKAAMAQLCVTNRRSAFNAVGRALLRTLRHPLRTLFTLVLLVTLAIVGSYAIGIGTAHFLEARQQPWIGLAFGQLGVLWSLLVVLAMFVVARQTMELGDPVVALAAPVGRAGTVAADDRPGDLRPRAFLLLFALVGADLAAQEPQAPLSPEFFRERRALVMQAIREHPDMTGRSSVVLLRGAQALDMGTFQQDHDFYYLSGVREPGVAMLLFPNSGAEELLVPPFNRFTATWDGDRLTPGEDAATASGFAQVTNVRALRRRLDELFAADEAGHRPVLWTFLEPQANGTATPASASRAAKDRARDFLDRRPSREQALAAHLEEGFEGLEIRDLTPIVGELRAVKTDAEIAQIEAASQAAVHGIAEAMKSVRPGVYEYQLAAAARYVFARSGAGVDAYAAIVGSGRNGCILHYSANAKRCEAGELVVMDYGPTINGYCTDVTRTFPVDGVFTPEQRQLVQDVYEVQQRIIAELRPGAKLSELAALCQRELLDRGYKSLHGPCHHVGLAVHDKQGDVLAAGMVITVEPGAYLRDKGMGCRIEDTIVITEDGSRVLSAGLPATPDAIEALMKKGGLQQQAVGLPGQRAQK